MNWTSILAGEARLSTLLRSDELARRYNLSEIVVRNALRRYANRGLVEHVANKVYINRLNQYFSPRELVNVLRPDSYVSLESALVEPGIITQSPSRLTCVTIGYPKTFRTPSATIVYRKITKNLFWGFEERSTRFGKYRIAEPEKALLDWVYLNRQEGLPTPLDEVNLRFVDLKKLRQYSERFPATVREAVKQLIVDHSSAA